MSETLAGEEGKGTSENSRPSATVHKVEYLPSSLLFPQLSFHQPPITLSLTRLTETNSCFSFFFFLVANMQEKLFYLMSTDKNNQKKPHDLNMNFLWQNKHAYIKKLTQLS